MSNTLQKLSSRRGWYVIPIIFITYSLAYLDCANYGFAAASGIEQDQGMSKSTSSLIGALFFLAYFFFQVPSSICAIAQCKDVNFYLFITMGIVCYRQRVSQ